MKTRSFRSDTKYFLSAFCSLLFLLSVSSSAQNLQINEYMASNNTAVADSFGGFDDWFEIFNPNPFPVNLAGYYLTNNYSNPFVYQVPSGNPSTIIPAWGYKIIWCDKELTQGPLHADFKLTAAGDSIGIVSPGGIWIDSLNFSTQPSDVSVGRTPDGGNSWTSFNTSTPYARNTPPVSASLFINEVMHTNSSTIQDNAGDYDTWVEIYNAGNTAADIGGYFMSNSFSHKAKFRVPVSNPATIIPPHGYLLLWCDNEISEGPLHNIFPLNSAGDFFAFFNSDSNLVDSVTFPTTASNHSWGRINDGASSWIVFSGSTPNSSNNTASVDSENRLNQLRAFPNPCNISNLHFSEPVSGALLKLDGSIILQFEETIELSVLTLPAGIYLIQTKTGQTLKVIRL